MRLPLPLTKPSCHACQVLFKHPLPRLLLSLMSWMPCYGHSPRGTWVGCGSMCHARWNLYSDTVFESFTKLVQYRISSTVDQKMYTSQLHEIATFYHYPFNSVLWEYQNIGKCYWFSDYRVAVTTRNTVYNDRMMMISTGLIFIICFPKFSLCF